MTTLSFEVEDVSPTISYYPLADTFSTPDLSAGWNPYYNDTGFAQSSGQTGAGASLHLTSRNGASLSIPFYGTKVQIFGNVTGSASVSLSLNDVPVQSNSTSTKTDGAIAALSDLLNQQHILSLTASTADTPDSFVVFDKAVIDTLVNSTGMVNREPIPENAISFKGQWSFTNDDGTSSHVSNLAGDFLQVKFTGSSIFVYGWTSPSSGNYSVTLDDSTRSFSAKSSFTQRDALLFHLEGLDPNETHSLKLSNEDGGNIAVNSNGFFFYGTGSNPSPSSPSVVSGSKTYPTGTIAALVLAGVLAFLVLSALLFYTFVYRPRRRRRAREVVMGSDGHGGQNDPKEPQVITPKERAPHRQSKRSSRWTGFARWKHEVETGFNGNTDLGITFQDAEEDKSSSQRRRSARSPVSRASSSIKSSISSWRERARRPLPSPNSFTVDLPPRNVHPFSRVPSLHSESSDGHLRVPVPADDSSLQYTSTISSASQQVPTSQPTETTTGEALAAFSGALLNPTQNGGQHPGTYDTRRVSRADIDLVRSLSPHFSSSYARDIARRSGSPLQTYKEERPRKISALRSLSEAPALGPSAKSGSIQPTDNLSAPLAPFLNLDESSPFRVDFMSSQGQNGLPAKRLSDQSRVHFEDEATGAESQTNIALSRIEQSPPESQLLHRPPEFPRGAVEASFLDLEVTSSLPSSSRPSVRTFGSSLHSSQQRRSDGFSQREPRSRWSTTTAAQTTSEEPSSSSGRSISAKPSTTSLSVASIQQPSSSSGSFPFPVSTLPTQRHPVFLQADHSTRIPDSTSNEGSHLSSDHDSVPRSISDIDFRHSDSEDDSGVSRRASAFLPSHPPLPDTPQSASYIVNRVLGHSRENSTTTDNPLPRH